MNAIIRHVARATHALADLVFPADCAGCGVTLASDEGDWCVDCASRLLRATCVPYCSRCGVAAGEYLYDAAGCAACRHRRIRPESFVRVGTYHDLVGQTLRRFKFNREHRLDGCLGGLLAAAIQGREWHRQIDALVPVPTDFRGRVRYRAWPVWLIATEVGRRLRLPVLPLVQLKGKHRRQVGLPASARPGNIRGVFRAHRNARIDGARLCIIDDVSTTGSTVQEVTRVLYEDGAAGVYAGVLAKTDPHRSDADPV